ncbi:AAA family ATPase [Croceicoccus sp. Ery5]|uniref:AAA family ATPase n=1 Tax=Croceicoccus sp. Ery5 TaxID=1703340 RepID=UPI001E626525|nr:AAA family ATPase [Croceicoccus sp. Ery5]
MRRDELRNRQMKLLGNAFVHRKVERDIHAALDMLRATRLDTREPSNVVIHGAPGVGKSFIIEQYLSQRRHISRENGSLRQDLLAIELEGATSPVLIAAEMAAQLGLSELPRGRIASDTGPITHAVKHQMLMQGVEMIIIDEFHHIAPNEGYGTASRIARWVKSLSKKKERSRQAPFGQREANIPIVMVGTRKVHDLVLKDPELLSITPYFFEIGRYTHDTPEEQRRWQMLLADLDDKLPFSEFSGLGNPVLAFKIHQVTYGFLRQLSQLIMEAGRLAIERGLSRIGEAELYESVNNQRLLLRVGNILDCGSHTERSSISNPFDSGQSKPMES